MLNILIMCGGTGTRLWPLSRDSLPKQFLNLTEEDLTMFQITCLRAKNINFDNLFVICNKEHIFLAKKQLDDLSIKNYKIIGEPFGKNTAAVIACASLLSDINSDILVMSSDHMWTDDIFKTTVNEGMKYCKESIVTFGIVPNYPETGYGYLHYKDNNLIKFVEKPSIERAKEYLENGNYLWNSGNFLFSNKVIKDEFKKNAKDIHDSVEETIKNSDSHLSEFILDSETFNKVRSESIDYAIMEKYQNGKVVPYNGLWSDIGSFKSLYDFKNKDIKNNVLDGDIHCIDTTNSFIKSNKLVTTIGINDLSIIDTPDVLFIGDINRSQEVKKFVNKFKEDKREEIKVHKKCFRPWGWYINIDGDDNSGSKVKRIGVYPGKRLSLQSHKKRSEHWVITKGQAKVQVGEDFHILHKNQSIYIPLGVLHRMENIGLEMVEFIETQIGDYLGEDDIIRYEDDFGRK